MAATLALVCFVCAHFSFVRPSTAEFSPHPVKNEVAELRKEMEEKMKEIIAGRELYLQSEITQLKNSIWQRDKEMERLKEWMEQKDRAQERFQDEMKEQKKELEEQRNELRKQRTELEAQKIEWKTELEKQKMELKDQRMELRKQQQVLKFHQEKKEWRHHRKETKNKYSEGSAPLEVTDFAKLLHALQQTRQQEADLSEADTDANSDVDGFGNKLQIRSDDWTILEPVVSQLTLRVDGIDAQLQAAKNTIAAAGSVYVRWGHAACPNSSDTVYSGYIGGPWFNKAGGASNYVCLPPNPVFDNHPVPGYGSAELYGTEYDVCNEPECQMSALCSVCHIPRVSSVMVPATDTCHPGWKLEYTGYLMANHPQYAASIGYICVDKSHGYIPATGGNENGALLYYTTAHCGSLSCPPYVNGKIVQCVVCSK